MKQRQTKMLLKAGSLAAALLILVSGVTFAALKSQNNVVSGSRMVSASADLNIAKMNTGQWYTTLPGYDFMDVMPGGAPSPSYGNDIYFKNGGSTNLELKMGVNLSRLTNQNGLNLNKVKILLVDAANNDVVFANFSVAELGNALGSGNPLVTDLVLGKRSTSHLQLRMQLEDGAVINGNLSESELSNIDIHFSGTAISG